MTQAERRTILHVDNSTAVTGAFKALLSWCLSTPEYVHIWALPQGSAVAAAAREHFTVYELPFVEIGRSAGRLLGYLPALQRNGRRLARIVDREAVDLLHANDLYNLTPYLARRRSSRRPKLLVHARMLKRSFPARIYEFWVDWHLKRADAIVAVSEAIRQDWRRDPRITLAYDPIDVREALPPYRFERSPGEPFRFLYFANYIAGKGQDDALQAVRRLRDAGVSDFRVDFYGGTMGLEKNEAYKAALQQQIESLRLGDCVQLHGAVAEVEALMKSHHALLHFSHAESFGMVCYEALYYGLPVISSDCGGPAEMMAAGTSGFLHPVGDTAAFAKSMQLLLENPALCRSVSGEASRFIRDRFSDTSGKLTAIVRTLIG